MVRLKASSAYLQIPQICIFQFHYGSVKRKVKSLITNSQTVFQFHYGSVKRDMAERYEFGWMEFQFHYGSVKSGGQIILLALIMDISIPLWFG